MPVIVVTGGSNGLGSELLFSLSGASNIINLDKSPPHPVVQHIDYAECDVSDYESVSSVAKRIDNIDILINCAGVNYINWIEHTPDDEWDRIMGVNAKGIFNTTKAFVYKLAKSKGTILNIVSNASHMPMTNSIAYNASKGAAHIMTLQMARELRRNDITVFGVSPNKLSDTKMSSYIDNTVPGLRGWTKEEAQAYQLKNLPAGEETDPTTLAEFIAFLLSTKKRHKYLAGCVIPYGA